jgi:hypothetical protein
MKQTRVEIKIWLPDGAELRLRGYMDELVVDREMVDATSWHDAHRTYLVGLTTFTLKGRTFPWKKKENPWASLSQPARRGPGRS